MELLNINDFINKLNLEDTLKKNDWNIRLLRHYTSIGAIPHPAKKGKEAYYSSEHLEKAKEISEARAMGVSIHKVYSSDYKGGDVLKNSIERTSLSNKSAELKVDDSKEEKEELQALIPEMNFLSFGTNVTSDNADESIEAKHFMAHTDPLDLSLNNMSQTATAYTSSINSNNPISVNTIGAVHSDSLKKEALSLLDKWDDTPLGYARSGLQKLSQSKTASSASVVNSRRLQSHTPTITEQTKDITKILKQETVEKYVLEPGLELYASQDKKSQAEELLKMWNEKNWQNK